MEPAKSRKHTTVISRLPQKWPSPEWFFGLPLTITMSPHAVAWTGGVAGCRWCDKN
ncbi:hypothetical protein ACFFX0_27270 [Citricoccus parietis]|uniref:Uncharacterized protein n=1 Tax=Citricoccus parietis TaxID=592307 RepID=A0ABV5G6W9_9MICC